MQSLETHGSSGLNNAIDQTRLPAAPRPASRPQPPGTRNRMRNTALILAAGIIYSLHLGQTLASSEAYTAMVANQASYGAVWAAALRFDPGKPPLYPILLHGLIDSLGSSEIVLRAPSVICSMIGVGLVIALGGEMFDPMIGFAGAAIFALSPVTVFYGRFARMYAMLVALALAQLLTMWKLQSKPSAARIAGCGMLGAAMLYTHLGSALFLGAEAAVLASGTWRGKGNRAGWAALGLSLALFVPFLPVAALQVRQLVSGHWVDWIGPVHQIGRVQKAVVTLSAGAVVALLTFAPQMETDEREPIRWCAMIGILPVLALAAGSLAVRPMFSIRYVAPSLALLILLAARLLAFLGDRALGLSTFGIACFLFFVLPYYPGPDAWREIAGLVATSGSSAEPVFFESGYVGSTAAETNPQTGFPQGFFRVPFDHYFKGRNPRLMIDPSSPPMARRAIAAAAIANQGAWLISGLKNAQARAEMPTGCFKIEKKVHSGFADLYQIKPITHCSGNPSGPGAGHATDAAASAMPFKAQ
jgi:hypothetical protein